MLRPDFLNVQVQNKQKCGQSYYLEKAGYQVSLLKRGDKVVRFIKNVSTDLILLDRMLPDMDGMELCRRIRKFSDIGKYSVTA